MEIKRTQGRPVRGAGDVGREKLLDGARAFLRSRPARNISRQEIAKAAGVTPALVSYYFPDKSTLIHEAAVPILETYITRLTAIVDSADDYSRKLEAIVAEALEFCSKDFGLMDVFMQSAQEAGSAEGREILAPNAVKLVAFFAEGIKRGLWRDLDPATMLLTAWSLAKAVAEAGLAADYLPTANLTSMSRDEQVRIVLDLLAHGLGPAT